MSSLLIDLSQATSHRKMNKKTDSIGCSKQTLTLLLQAMLSIVSSSAMQVEATTNQLAAQSFSEVQIISLGRTRDFTLVNAHAEKLGIKCPRKIQTELCRSSNDIVSSLILVHVRRTLACVGARVGGQQSQQRLHILEVAARRPRWQRQHAHP